jgi:aldose 1-epimerase
MRESIGSSSDGGSIERFILTNQNGTSAHLINMGASLTELHVRDRNGELGDVVLGYAAAEAYEENVYSIGCTIGRVTNRIGGGRFTLDGVEYRLAANLGEHHLHGGIKGFNKVLWRGEPCEHAAGSAVRFTYHSADGEEGYPGNLELVVTYVLTEDDAVRIEYEGTTDKPTPVNLTNHSYFNLAGAAAGSMLDQVLKLYAGRYTVPDETALPTGEIRSVEDSPLDFRQPVAIGARIDQVGKGYDHNYVLDHGKTATPELSAEVRDPASGRFMQLLTTEPGVQLYSGQFLDSVEGKGGASYEKYHGFCLETQHFPDSVNKAHFPSTILRPGETYRQTTIYRFSVVE